jgi:folylpolyglutamate synthase
MSVKIAPDWFAEVAAELDESATRVLVFSHVSELRDAMALLRNLAIALKDADIEIPHVVFTTYDASQVHGSAASTKELHEYHHEWSKVFPNSTLWDEMTVPGAIGLVKRLSRESSGGTQVLVTGSQHLVGPALRVLQGG